MNFFCVRLRARSEVGEISALLLRLQSPFSFLGHESAILLSQKRERFALAMLDLVHRTLSRVFVGTPAQESRAVSKPATGKMIVRYFHHHFGRNRFPFPASLGAPAAGASGRAASEPGRFSQPLSFFLLTRGVLKL
jgi:hypothetical protein